MCKLCRLHFLFLAREKLVWRGKRKHSFNPDPCICAGDCFMALFTVCWTFEWCIEFCLLWTLTFWFLALRIAWLYEQTHLNFFYNVLWSKVRSVLDTYVYALKLYETFILSFYCFKAVWNIYPIILCQNADCHAITPWYVQNLLNILKAHPKIFIDIDILL